jgi:phasin family protein
MEANMATATKTAARTTRSASEAFEQAASFGGDALRENIDRGMAAMSEASAFGKENLEAWTASATAAQKGFETLMARSVAFSKTAMENHMAASKALLTSKSVQEFAEKQTEYARASFDAYVAELTSVSDLVAGVAKDTLAPINERMSAVGQLMQNQTR